VSYKLIQEKENGKVIKLSLGVAEVDAYLKFLKQRCRPNTWISYGYDLQIFLNTLNKPLVEVTPLDILAFIESQKEVPKPRERISRWASPEPGFSNATIRRRLAAIAGLYEYLRVFQGLLIKDNPVPRSMTRRTRFWGHRFNNSSVTPLIKVTEALPRPLNTEEVSLFVNTLRNHRDKAMMLLMLLAGLRKTEMLNLTLQDINFAQRTLFVRDGKGGYQRTVAISDTGLKELLSYLKKERPQSNSDRLFLVLKGPHRGQPLTIAGVDEIVEYHRQIARTPGVQCHRLRHTCFTQLRQGGMSLEAIQAQAGHKSIVSTRIYLHLCPKELQQEHLKLSGTLFNLPPANGRSGNG